MRECLQEISIWSKSQQESDLIQITIDLKSGACLGDDEIFCEKIDEMLITELGGLDKIFTPTQLKRDAPTLLEGARRFGWPILQELKNKFIITLSGIFNFNFN